MNISKAIIAEIESMNTKQVRIEWEINGKTGHGGWAIGEPSDLQSAIDAMNMKYGSGTHWLAVKGEAH